MTSAALREEGDTLLEVLIAVVLISLTVAALLGALVTSITSAGEHRTLADIDTVLKSYAENAQYAIDLQSSPWYTDCATVTTGASSAYDGRTVTTPPVPSGWSEGPYIVGIRYWNNTTHGFDSPCQAGDEQLLTLGATAPNGITQTLTIGLRSPS